MSDPREDMQRELAERQTDEKRQWSGSTPTERTMERALEEEDETRSGTVEWHAGEDAGEVPRIDDSDVPETGGNPT